MSFFNPPNALTALRLLLAPFAVHAIVAGEYRQAVAIFAAAAATDGLDGYLARRFSWKTRLGAYLDPIADKALLSATYLALGAAGIVPWWIVGIVFGRDLLILVLAAIALLATDYRDFPPSVWGKLSTAIQVLAAAAVIVNLAFPQLHAGGLARAMLWAVVAMTLWSGLDYMRRAAELWSADRRHVSR